MTAAPAAERPPERPVNQPAAPRRWRRVVGVAAVLWLVATLAASHVPPALDRRGGFVDAWAFAAILFQTARPIVGVVLLLLAVLTVRRGRGFAGLLLIVGGTAIAPELRHAWPARGDAEDGISIRVVSLNNERLTTNSDAVAEMIGQADPDLIAFEQFAAATDTDLASLIGEQYPHRIAFASPPFQGIALYSKWPARVVVPPDFRSSGHGRILVAEIEIGGQAVRVVVVHLTSPRTSARVAANRTELATLLARIDPATPTVVVGDFNAPMGSQSVGAMRAAGFAHADDRAGVGPRWTWMPAAGVPIARIDHLFVSPHFGITESLVLGAVRSDHLPICVDLQLRPLP